MARPSSIAHGLQQTIDQYESADRGFKRTVQAFVDDLRSHLWLDGGRLAVAHASLKAEMIGRGSGAVREFALYGETTGEIDEFGLPVRADWAANYRGDTTVIYGHTPVVEAEWVNNTLCIDTGCVFGGKLTAFRRPERELVQSPARAALARASARGFPACDLTTRFTKRARRADLFARAWAPYVWPVSGVDDLRVAPFHVLASEGQT